MSRKVLFSSLKLIVLAALVVWVVERVPFRDSAHPEGATKQRTLTGKLEPLGSGRAVFISTDGERHEFLIETADSADSNDGRGGIKWKEETTGQEWQLRHGLLYRLAHLNPWYFLLGAMSFFTCASFAAVRWNYLLRANGVRTSQWETWRLYWVGTFFNNFVPGLTGGDLVRAYYIAKRTGQKTVPILTVMVDRVLGVMALALLSFLMVLFNLDKFADLAWGIFAFVFGLGLLTVLFLSGSTRRFLGHVRWLERYTKSGFMQQLMEALDAYQTQKALLLFWLLASVANHLFSTGFVALLGMAMGLEVSFSDYFVLVPVIYIASAVPITPSGWGVSEALFDLLFVKFAGLAVGDGAGLCALSRVVGICWSLLGGLLLLFMKDSIEPQEMERAMQSESGI